MLPYTKYAKEIYYLLGSSKKSIPWIVILFLVSSLIDMLGIGLIGPYIGYLIDPTILENNELSRYLTQYSHEKIIVIISIVLLFVFILKGIIAISVAHATLKFSLGRSVRMQSWLMKKFQSMGYEEYLARNSSEYIQEMISYTGGYVLSLKNITKMIGDLITTIFIVALLFVVNPYIVGALLLTLGLVFVFYDRWFKDLVREAGERININNQKMIQGVNEALSGLKDIRINNKEKYFRNIVEKATENVAKNSLTSGIVAISPRYVMESIIVAFIVVVILVSINLGYEIEKLIPVLSVFAVASIRILPSATLFTSGLTLLRVHRHGVSVLYEELKNMSESDYSSDEVFYDNVIDDKPFEKLEIKKVSYCYPNTSKLILDDVTLSIESGEALGIIGASGSGKSTLVDLILGLLVPQDGVILFNTNEIKNLTLQKWRSKVAYLPQDIFIVDKTLKENIALGIEKNNIDLIKLRKSLKYAQLEGFVNALPNGLDTFIGEKGARISGGQRQRIALARAFYNNKEVLIMDEATSALDPETEKEIVQEINLLKGKVTIIVIAHRLSTIKNCDRIIRIDNGKIVQDGSYSEVVLE